MDCYEYCNNFESQEVTKTPSKPITAGVYVNVTPTSDVYERGCVPLDDQKTAFDGFIAYERDTYFHRMSLESHYYPQNFLRTQPEMTPEVRSALVEWMTRVCHQYGMFPETLFLAVNIADRFLETTPIALDCSQLLGAASLLIASKQEEPIAMHLCVTQILQMAEQPYSRRQVLQMERLVLRRLQFDLLAPTALYFMETLTSYAMHSHPESSASTKFIERRRSMARYLLELSLQDYDLCQYSPSVLGSCVLTITEDVLKDGFIFFQLGTASAKRSILFKNCMNDLKLLAEATLETQNLHDSYTSDSFDASF